MKLLSCFPGKKEKKDVWIDNQVACLQPTNDRQASPLPLAKADDYSL